jgi:penicillin-insensitive murein endopeptidase
MVPLLILVSYLYATPAWALNSECYGTTSNGYLKNGVALPAEGDNFVSYSYLAQKLGRTYVHSTVRDILLDAYKTLQQQQPGKKYKYAETGFQEGGEFKPHKTHRNGLSVDFMVPVINSKGESVYFSTNPLNKWGYSVEFDKNGRYEDYSIDYEAMAAHIVELHKQAKQQGVDIWRVIFDPQLQPRLFANRYGDYLKQHIQFSSKRSWVRHDEHYHVDFSVPCKPLQQASRS